MFSLHLPLSSLSWFLNVAVVVAAILEDGDVDLLELNVARMEADRVPLRKAFGNASPVNAVITFPRSAGRNSVDLSGHNYPSDFSAPRSTQDYSSTFYTIPESSTVVLTQEEYDQLRQLEFSHTNFSATHAFASGMHTYTVSPQKSCILDSGASFHMTGITQKFISLNMSTAYLSVKITDGTHSSVLGNGVLHATPSLTLTDVFYVSRFPVSLLSTR